MKENLKMIEFRRIFFSPSFLISTEDASLQNHKLSCYPLLNVEMQHQNTRVCNQSVFFFKHESILTCVILERYSHVLLYPHGEPQPSAPSQPTKRFVTLMELYSIETENHIICDTQKSRLR